MSITINQQPLNYTPSNAQHIYNASSTLSGNTSMRYVFDIWINPFTTPERIARVKVAPNSYGVGIVDVGDIVKNYTKPNTRSNIFQVNNSAMSTYSSLSNPNGQIPFSLYILQPSNQFNTNPTYPFLPHVGEYRVLVGEEYQTTGGTIVTDICSSPEIIPSEWAYSLDTAALPYAGSPNRVNITGAGAALPDYANTNLLGWTYLQQTNTGTFVASGTTTAQTGSYTATTEPGRNDILTITENYSSCRFSFQWSDETEVPGWLFISQFCPSCEDNPQVITIWPGVQQNKKIYNYNNSWWGNNNTNAENNHLWWDKYRYEWQTYTNISGDTPAQFLTTFSDEYYPYTFSATSVGQTTIQCRKRSHHWECPLVIGFFYKDFQTITLGSNADTFKGKTGSNLLLHYDSSVNGTYTSTTPDNRIMYKVWTPYAYGNQRDLSGNDFGFYLETTGGGGQVNYTRRITEGVVYQVYGDNCMSDPQHFLFLNQNGIWDVWTFDRKNIKTYNKGNSVYAQGLIKNNSIYNPLFNSQRNIIYDQTILEVVEAQSHFMEENDRRIVEELFLSTHVYLMKDFYYNTEIVSTEEYTKTPHLIPVTITSNSIQEYKQRYNKVFQYTLTYEYNPIQQHRSNL